MSLSDDFARWQDDPVTRMVFEGLKRAEQAQKDAWDGYSWGGGKVRPEDLADTLKELRVRADCYAALREMTLPDLMGWLGIEDDDAQELQQG